LFTKPDLSPLTYTGEPNNLPISPGPLPAEPAYDWPKINTYQSDQELFSHKIHLLLIIYIRRDIKRCSDIPPVSRGEDKVEEERPKNKRSRGTDSEN
jgi:hypothetical protein